MCPYRCCYTSNDFLQPIGQQLKLRLCVEPPVDRMKLSDQEVLRHTSLAQLYWTNSHTLSLLNVPTRQVFIITTVFLFSCPSDLFNALKQGLQNNLHVVLLQ